jgi:hypothetical protein
LILNYPILLLRGGANYRAARRAKPDADFVHKLKIVEEAAGESVYFPELPREF